MSIDERDYYYDPKQFRNVRRPTNTQALANEDAHWREVAARQKVLKRNLIILGVGVVALAWLFSGEFSHFLKSFSMPHQQSEKPVLDTFRIIPPTSIGNEQQFPESGSIIQYQTSSGISAKFTVVLAKERTGNCVVRLERWNDGVPVIELFVRVGEQAETQAVPLGEYRAKIACGTHWYGRKNLFGRDTMVSVGETPLRFWQSGSTTNGNILTLTKDLGGNFKTNDSYFNKF